MTWTLGVILQNPSPNSPLFIWTVWAVKVKVAELVGWQTCSVTTRLLECTAGWDSAGAYRAEHATSSTLGCETGVIYGNVPGRWSYPRWCFYDNLNTTAACRKMARKFKIRNNMQQNKHQNEAIISNMILFWGSSSKRNNWQSLLKYHKRSYLPSIFSTNIFETAYSIANSFTHSMLYKYSQYLIVK